jgi:diacylglycerol kinase (ATP)
VNGGERLPVRGAGCRRTDRLPDYGSGVAAVEIVVVGLLLVVAALVLVAAALVAVRGRGWRSPDQDTESAGDEDSTPLPLVAVVVNPSKFDDVRPLRRVIEQACTQYGWAEPLWLETTEEDPGGGQARQALAAAADLVVACGGDGTVRHVAQELAGSGRPLGLLPTGTGNLLARNLDLTLGDPASAMRAALAGTNRRLDVGWARMTGPDGEDLGPEEAFLVMAGLGFDAAVMAGAPEALKARVGPFAYVVSGLRQLRGRRVRVTITVDGGQPIHRRVRTVLVGNVGTLLGGLTLMPDASVDDGWLDGVTIAPEGLAGWAAVALRVITRTRKGHPRVEHWRGREITIEADHPEQAQLDGDPVGRVSALHLRIQPLALALRVPVTVRPTRTPGTAPQ